MCYAMSGVVLNIFSFVLPPVAGAFASINFITEQSGIIMFYTFMLTINLLIDVGIYFRDKKLYASKLSVKPQ